MKDDKVDDDRDGIADVDQISNRELYARKVHTHKRGHSDGRRAQVRERSVTTRPPRRRSSLG